MPHTHNDTEASFQKEVKAVLERRGYATDIPALNELIGSFKFDSDRINRKVRIYKGVGFALLLAIPVISTIITFVVGLTQESSDSVCCLGLKSTVPWLSLFLTLLTVLNSVLKPSVRFDRSCRIGLDLFHWRCAFLEGLEKLAPVDDSHLLAFLTEQRKQLRKIQESQINLALPDQS